MKTQFNYTRYLHIRGAKRLPRKLKKQIRNKFGYMLAHNIEIDKYAKEQDKMMWEQATEEGFKNRYVIGCDLATGKDVSVITGRVKPIDLKVSDSILSIQGMIKLQTKQMKCNNCYKTAL